MRLIAELERQLAGEESLFRAQLLREDLARLRRLLELKRDAADEAMFVEQGSHVGWTPGEARTAELQQPLAAFLRAAFAGDEDRMAPAWQELHRLRLERLLGCLSTPVPRPQD
ncbi:MAG: hypothetical protein FJY47_02410 [Betaproteobacteria bacterium]|nr:hypothetical protein [Betaproteobacteria bacterium]MBM3354675.1 hypothetical protein [Betaproteobacteria bacterium]